MRHFEGLDSKAGVLLGFSGVLVALTTRTPTPVGALAAFAALLAIVFALSAYMPRRVPTLDVLPLRDRYLTAHERFSRLHLLDTKIEMIRELAGIVREKALRLRIGLVLLAISGLLLIADQVATISVEARP